MALQTPLPCSIFRGGTSKGLYLFAKDLPTDVFTRDAVLMALMGTPDARQIDGLGGAHPLTSKVAIISSPTHPDADFDYLFLQIGTDQAVVSDSQNCGNLLAGVGAFVIKAGLMEAQSGVTSVCVHMLNTASLAVVRTPTPDRKIEYEGNARIDGVPSFASPVLIDFLNIAGGSCGALLPTGNTIDMIDNIETTLIDNGMPVVLVRAADIGVSGHESPLELEANTELGARIERIRLAAGLRMNLGSVAHKTVPKISLVSPPLAGGVICTRTYIPHRVHESIGVFGAVSVATACVLPDTVASMYVGKTAEPGRHELRIEHPSGAFDVQIELVLKNGVLAVERSALLRTTRLLMSGVAYIPGSVWRGGDACSAHDC